MIHPQTLNDKNCSSGSLGPLLAGSSHLCALMSVVMETPLPAPGSRFYIPEVGGGHAHQPPVAFLRPGQRLCVGPRSSGAFSFDLSGSKPSSADQGFPPGARLWNPGFRGRNAPRRSWSRGNTQAPCLQPLDYISQKAARAAGSETSL